LERTDKSHKPALKHGIYMKGIRLCDFCKRKQCPERATGEECALEKRELESVKTLREAEEKLQFEVAKEMIRLITRLKIGLTFGEINMNVQSRVVALAINFLKILEKRKAPGGVVKDLATILAEAKKKRRIQTNA